MEVKHVTAFIDTGEQRNNKRFEKHNSLHSNNYYFLPNLVFIVSL